MPDFDPNAPYPLDTPPALPPSWLSGEYDTPPPMQPGIGVPAPVVDQAAAAAAPPMPPEVPAPAPPLGPTPTAEAAPAIPPLAAPVTPPIPEHWANAEYDSPPRPHLSAIDDGSGEMDAISGGTRPTPEEPQSPPDLMPPEDEDPDLAVQQRANALATNDDEYLNERDKLESGRNSRRMALEVDAERRNLEAKVKNHLDYQNAIIAARKKSEAIEADAQRIANAPIKERDLTPLQWVAGMIGAIVGGLNQKNTGGRNLGLEAFNQQIDRHIEVQKANLANQRANLAGRRSALGEEYARTGDLFHAQEAVRLAAYEQAAKMIDAEIQNYDPRSTRALALADAKRQLLAQGAAARAKQQEAVIKQQTDIAKADREERELQERVRSAQAKERIDSWSIASANKRAEEDRKLKREELDSAAADRFAKQQSDAMTNATKEDRELGMAAPPALKTDGQGAPVLDEKGQPVIERAAKLVNADKTTWHAPDPDTARKLRKSMFAAREITSIIDEIEDVRDKVGGESSTFNSDEAQRFKVLQNRLVVLAKSGTEGMSSDEDMKKLSDALGASDVASFRARAAGLEEGRRRTVSALNNEMQINHYSGKPIEFPNLNKLKKTSNNEEDLAERRMYELPNISQTEAEAQARREMLFKSKELRKTDPAAADELAQRALDRAKSAGAEYKDIAPDQRQRLSDTTARASKPGPDGDAALQKLQDYAQNGGTETIRKLAADGVQSAMLGRQGADLPTAIGPTTSTAHVEAPPPPPARKGK